MYFSLWLLHRATADYLNIHIMLLQEWLWPLGYFMRAKLIMAERMESQTPDSLKRTMACIENKLASHHLAILSSDWRSLPELTNSDGKVCYSCIDIVVFSTLIY